LIWRKTGDRRTIRLIFFCGLASDFMEFLEFASYLALGAGAGLLAGLLGVGGGAVIVPVLTYIFTAHGFLPEYVQHLAVGTSLASILFTSLSSVRSHHARGAVSWEVLRGLIPGILLGTLSGAWLASYMSPRLLKVIFVCFAYFVVAQILVNIKPKPGRELPGRAGMSLVGGVAGVLSSFVGVGGGAVSMPFLTRCNVPMRTVIGTSSAVGFPIALAGAVGFIVNGLHAGGLPPLSLGFVYLPALLGISIASVLTAPLGAKLAHSLPVGKLKKLFALMLFAVATDILAGLL
jgi:uncharacterized membrane protein YfcA